MIRLIIFILASLCSFVGYSQRNCNVFKWEGDSCRYEACVYLENAPGFFQLTRQFHEIYDEALEICPIYSDAYRAKSVAYLKTGDFVQWKKLMDKAVELDPAAHLGYRGWCRFQFFRDYQGAIDDFDLLESTVNHDIGFSQNAMYHLTVAKTLCYKMLGKTQQAIEILSAFVDNHPDMLGLYEYLHLGVLYLESDQFSQAQESFEKQKQIHDIAENEYYLAMVTKQYAQIAKSITHLKRAKKLYIEGQYMYDPYTHQVDKIYLADIERALNMQQ